MTECYLEALPGEAALEQEHEGVGKGLQVISPAAGAAKVGMHTGIPDGAPEVIWLLLILDMLSPRSPPLGGCSTQSNPFRLSIVLIRPMLIRPMLLRPY